MNVKMQWVNMSDEEVEACLLSMARASMEKVSKALDSGDLKFVYVESD